MPETTFDIEVIEAAHPGVTAYFNGGVVYAKGETRDCAYMVRSGRVELRGEGGAIGTVSRGEIFGEMALLDDQPHACSAIAVSDAELIEIDRGLFRTLVRDDPDFATTILNLLVRQLRAAITELERRPPIVAIMPARPEMRKGAA